VTARAVALVKGARDVWAPTAMGTLLDSMATWSPDKPALVFEGRTCSYVELADSSRRLAAGLAGIGLTPGEPAVILMENTPEWVISWFALARLGCPAIPISPRFVPREIAYVVEQSAAVALLASRSLARTSLADLLGSIAPDLRRKDESVGTQRFPALRLLAACGEGPEVAEATDLDSLRAPAGLRGKASNSSAIGIVQYTSGTTGFPKGVMLRQDQIIHNAVCVGRRLGARSADVFYTPMPFFHVGGSVLSVLLSIAFGATLVFSRSFDPQHMLETIEKLQCTLTAGVETMFLRMMRLPEFESFRGNSLRAGWGAAHPAVYDHFNGFVNIYGMSESSPNAAMAYWYDPLTHRRDACGWVQQGIELGIADRDSEDAEWLGRNEHGEIRVRGWSVMSGYLNNPEATAAAISPDGWLRTGDIGFIDFDGAVHFVGRSKDTIRVGGELVSAREIEEVFTNHPNVRAACVVPIPDPEYGETPLICIETRDGSEPSEAMLLYGRENLARFKAPRRVVFLTDWPTTESGKIQKFTLARLLQERQLV
jgi:fatty-acyl-CoA synthase